MGGLYLFLFLLSILLLLSYNFEWRHRHTWKSLGLNDRVCTKCGRREYTYYQLNEGRIVPVNKVAPPDGAGEVRTR